MKTYDGCPITTFEALKKELKGVEYQLAVRLSLDDFNIRSKLIELDRSNKLIEDELVSKWHELLAWYNDMNKENKVGLKDATVEELQAELKARAVQKEAPDPLESKDFTSLVEVIVNGIKDCVDKRYEDDNFKHDVFETAIEAVYGKSFWDWRNKQDW